MATFESLQVGEERQGRTCLVVTAGIGMVDTIDRIGEELDSGWKVEVVATPQAAEWIDAGGMREPIKNLTGNYPQSTYRSPWDAKPETMYNRCVVAPVTLNTLTKWADGHADNLALSMLSEAIGTNDVDVVAHLTLNGAYRDHPATDPAINVLQGCGVKFVPYEPGSQMKRVISSYPQNQLAKNLRRFT